MRPLWLGQVPIAKPRRMGSAHLGARVTCRAGENLYKIFEDCTLVASGTAHDLAVVMQPPACVNGYPASCPQASQTPTQAPTQQPASTTPPAGSGGATTPPSTTPAANAGAQQTSQLPGQASTISPQGPMPTQNTTTQASPQASPLPGQASPVTQPPASYGQGGAPSGATPTSPYGQGGAPTGAIPTSPFSGGQFTAMPGMPQSMFAQCPVVGGAQFPGWTTVIKLS